MGGNPPGTDLDAIYRGGENFLKRMEALGRLRDQQEAAYAKLQIGKDARVALDEARRLETEADAKLAAAAAKFSDAEAVKLGADRYAEATMRAADDVMAQARAKNAAADKALADTQAAAAWHRAEAAAAKEAAARADATNAALQGKLSRLRAELDKIEAEMSASRAAPG
jgi:hypothetical protein